MSTRSQKRNDSGQEVEKVVSPNLVSAVLVENLDSGGHVVITGFF